MDLIFSLLLFVITLIFHINLHNFLIKLKISSINTVIIFPIAIIINYLILVNSVYYNNIRTIIPFIGYSLPITSSIVFFVLSSMYILYFGSAFYGDYSPSSKLYMYLLKHKTATYTDIKNLFSDQELVLNRLNDLSSVGFVYKKKDNYFIGPKGKITAKIIKCYRKLLGWKSSG